MSSRYFNRPSRSSRKQNRSGRGLRFEGLECRTMMSATPLSVSGPDADMDDFTPTIRASVTPIPSKELAGLTNAEARLLENLASRANPAAANATSPPAPYMDSATLVIHGCSGDDNVEVKSTTGKPGDVTVVQKLGNSRTPVRTLPFKHVQNIVFLAYDGNNTFTNSLAGQAALPSQALGGSGVDTFIGNDKSDVFFGLGNNDSLKGGHGSDKLYGGTGKDTLDAGPNDNGEGKTVNILKGGWDNDTLVGGAGVDYMYGNRGNDNLTDDGGNGYLYGGKDNDVLKGYDRQGGYLEMHGGGGADTLKVRGHNERSYTTLRGKDNYQSKNSSRSSADLALYTAFADETLWWT